MIIHSIPHSSTYRNPAIEFVAPLNLITGKYEFEEIKIPLLKLDPSALYLMENLSVGSNISNEDFTTGRIEKIQFEFFYEKSPVRCQHFPDLLNINSVDFPININNLFYSTAGDNYLMIRPSGIVQQQIDMIDLENLILTVRADIYEIGAGAFVDQIKKEWTK